MKDLSRFLYYTKVHLGLVWFSESKNRWWGDPFYLQFWVRWSLGVAPKPPRGLKNQNGRVPSKIALRLTKVFLCENCQRQRCKAFIGLIIRAKLIGWGRPLLREIRWSEIANEVNCGYYYFLSIFARSASAVTSGEKVQLTLMETVKSTTRFPMSPRWTSRSLSLSPSPKGGSKTQSVQNLNINMLR